ncbi:hypothetical protein [Spirulina sp. 06S082]|uniref:hypothetical protein n=1 Tax=Spirulina sp. 06S082 TaxID=3110248 RepID=UPI002B217D98|nr:hypothetical protein [Spirulina sp. 06S082]MEA5472005.1 hypothetical protein [Spirulina sp. 06S082]
MTQNPRKKDEFYVNYGKMPSGFLRHLLWFIPLLAAIAIALALLLPGIHDHFNEGRFAGRSETEGILLAKPVPHLLVPRSGETGTGVKYSRYILMDTDKSGVDESDLEKAGQWVSLTGITIHRDSLTVIATQSVEAIDTPENAPTPDRERSLGEFTLVGEILDSKCYPGVMKRGRTAIHRSCAIRCISGGVPPIFLVENEAGEKMYFVLSDREGKAVNDRILDKVADEVRITGEVIQAGDMFILKADPDTYELV